jgi:Rrf2 family iron-sulfur cluster assembly transcriptional regulator
MKITALEEYGLRCLMVLGNSWPQKALTMPEISKSEGLSISYVGKLLMILKQAGLVKAVRGRKGGYTLAGPPQALRLDTIFAALGEPLFSKNYCRKYSGDNDLCVHLHDCSVRHMWWSFGHFINNVLEKLTLADLLNGGYEKVIESLNVKSGSEKVLEKHQDLRV